MMKVSLRNYFITSSLIFLPQLREKGKRQNDEKRRRRVKKRYKTQTNSTSVTIDDDVLRWARVQRNVKMVVCASAAFFLVGSFGHSLQPYIQFRSTAGVL